MSIEEIVSLFYGYDGYEIDYDKQVIVLDDGYVVTFAELYTEWQRFKDQLDEEY